MRKSIQTLNIISFIVIIFSASVSCKKMDDTYRQFIESGETIYVGKADSLLLRGGDNRIEVSWLLISDPKVSRYKIYWNNKGDSLEAVLSKTPQIDTVRVVIDNLKEGIYHFEVYLFDKTGNTSIKALKQGRVYGSQYQNSLLNRAYRSVRRIGEDIEVNWMPADESLVQVEIEYLNNGSLVKHIVPKNLLLDTLKDVPIGSQMNYRSVFLPDTNALDTFSTLFEELTLFEIIEEKLDKSLWKHLPLPTDTYQPEFEDWSIKNLWDDKLDVNSIFYVKDFLPGIQLPNWFTIDLGKKSIISKVKVNQLSHNDAWLFTSGAPQEFEIYGSNSPGMDGGWDAWTLLGEFESIKPSGKPTGELTTDDILLGKAGEEFTLQATGSMFRYVRFKTNKTWGGNANVMLAELTFYGQAME